MIEAMEHMVHVGVDIAREWLCSSASLQVCASIEVAYATVEIER